MAAAEHAASFDQPALERAGFYDGHIAALDTYQLTDFEAATPKDPDDVTLYKAAAGAALSAMKASGAFELGCDTEELFKGVAELVCEPGAEFTSIYPEDVSHIVDLALPDIEQFPDYALEAISRMYTDNE